MVGTKNSGRRKIYKTEEEQKMMKRKWVSEYGARRRQKFRDYQKLHVLLCKKLELNKTTTINELCEKVDQLNF